MTENTKTNIWVGIVLACMVLLAFVPDEWQLPLGVGGLVIGVGGVFGVRQYLQRLRRAERVMAAPENRDRPELLLRVLSKAELGVLGLAGAPGAESALRILKARRKLLVTVGTAFGVAALAAFLLLSFHFDF